jgi:hypothetical protein
VHPARINLQYSFGGFMVSRVHVIGSLNVLFFGPLGEEYFVQQSNHHHRCGFDRCYFIVVAAFAGRREEENGQRA